MLIGRDAECARIERVLNDARTGTSSVLVVRGEPGIGKTALLRYAEERAAGMTLLSARGIESESELPYAGLGDLLRPLLGRLDQIPPPQSAALAGALALAPPAGADRFAVCAASLSVVAAAAEDEPVLALVDDAHWLDAGSSEALQFTARRLLADGVALIIAVRDEEDGVFRNSGLPNLRLTGVDRAAALKILATRRRLAPQVAAQLHGATAGNPLALIEMADSLSDEELTTGLPIDEPLFPGRAVERAFLRRVGGLPRETRLALLVAAAGNGQSLPAFAARALAPAEATGLVSVAGDRFEFRHPLLRSAIYHGASPADRRAAHRALAAALNGRSADLRAWHRAAAAVEPDEEVAAALEATADAARLRGGHGAVERALSRAAELTPEPETRVRRLIAAATAAMLAGRNGRSVALADEALASTSDSVLRAEAQLVRSITMMWRAPEPTYERLRREAVRIEPTDRELAARVLVNAAAVKLMTRETGAMLDAARNACKAAGGTGGATEGAATILLQQALLLRGESTDRPRLVAACERLITAPEQSMHIRHLRPLFAAALGWLEENEAAQRLLRRVVDDGNAPGFGPMPLVLLAETQFQAGNWLAATSTGTEAAELAEETGQLTSLAHALVGLARIAAAQGRESDCHGCVKRALGQKTALEAGGIPIASALALGLLDLGLGRPEEAVARLEPVGRWAEEREIAHPAALRWAPDLIEAYAAAGRPDAAVRALERLERQARVTGSPWGTATAARCRGLMAGDEAFEREFVVALEWHDQVPSPFERARTDLCFGERLSRARQRVEARARLHAALEVFERLGAEPWSERARRELARSGAHVRPRSAPAIAELTPQELRVALAVGEGASNKEAAAALFLSPKTIEFHLGNVYRKLSIRSRADLARLIASER